MSPLPNKNASLTIREARREDMAAMHQLVVELAVYEKEPDAVVTTVEEYQRDFDAGIFQGLVAEWDGQVVGMMLYFMAYSTWKGRMLYLDDFVVNERFRGKGIGEKLFAQFLEKAREAGVRLVKWQVLDWNEPAIRFYRDKLQAIIEDEWLNGKIMLV